MKKILSILLISFCSLAANAQSLVDAQIGQSEYASIAERNHLAYSMTGGIPQLISGAPLVNSVYGGPHHSAMIDTAGNLWMWLDNSAGQLGQGNQVGAATPVEVTRDSTGNPFTGGGVKVVYVSCGGNNLGAFWKTIALKNDGTVWIAGNTQGGDRGNNTAGYSSSPYFVKVQFPVGVFIVKVIAGLPNIALDNTGGVWTWGASGDQFLLGQGSSPTWMLPGKLNLGAQAAIDIAGGTQWNYAITNTGRTWAWGNQNRGLYMGIQFANVPNTAQDITSFLNLPKSPTQICVNNESSYVILSDSTLWGWGGNANGTMGNGQELQFWRYGCCPFPYGTTTLFVYNWDQGFNELMQLTPIQIAPGIHNFTNIYTSTALNYTTCVKDANHQLYYFARNKGGEICNGVLPGNVSNGALQANYPNSWDVPWITRVNPWALSRVVSVSSPWCVSHSTTFCSVYSIPNVAGPKAHSQTRDTVAPGSFVLQGHTTSASSTPIYSTIWTQINGPLPALITLNSDSTPTVSGLIPGTYIFQFNITDANWRVDSVQDTVIVGNIPNVSAGSNQTITLPTSSVTLTGTASGTGGATIASYDWAIVSGPLGSSIASPNTASTAVTFLQSGTYVFILTVRDSNGASNSATVTITVNPVPASGPGFFIFHRYYKKIIK